MEIDTDLVERAMQGSRQSLRQLAEAVHDPLRSYVFRITLNDDLTDDIVQETIIEMFNVFKQLKEADRFWPWLCKVALNKVRGQSRTQTRRKRLLVEHARQLTGHQPNVEGLAAEIGREIKEAIFQAMAGLSDEQKAILSMRCYEEMPYSQISEIMGISEMNCRLSFYRTRKKLQKNLFRYGFGKEAVLAGLVIFGKLTAPSEAAAAAVSITPATLSTGLVATAIGVSTSTTALVAVAGGALTVGIAAVSIPAEATDPGVKTAAVSLQHGLQSAAKHWISEGSYFYPQGPGGPVMTRLSVADENGNKTAQILQNNGGNYYFNPRTQRTVVENHHYWNPDFSVMMLPTDPPDLQRFIASIENRTIQLQAAWRPLDNLLFYAARDKAAEPFSCSVQAYDALAEERFHYAWPADSGISDHRDEIHKAGRCIFKITGTVREQYVTAQGRMPFVYDSALVYGPWMELRVDGRLIPSDTPDAYFLGINRPWRGLHTVDSIRRDAAAKGIRFETQAAADGVTVRCLLPEGTVEYLVDMDRDWIRRVLYRDGAGDVLGQLEFEYLPAGSQDGSFNADRSNRQAGGRHWIFELMKGTLG